MKALNLPLGPGGLVLVLLNPPGLFPGSLTLGIGSSSPLITVLIAYKCRFKGWSYLLADKITSVQYTATFLPRTCVPMKTLVFGVTLSPIDPSPSSPYISPPLWVSSKEQSPQVSLTQLLTLQMNATQSCDVKIDRRFPLRELPHPLEGTSKADPGAASEGGRASQSLVVENVVLLIGGRMWGGRNLWWWIQSYFCEHGTPSFPLHPNSGFTAVLLADLMWVFSCLSSFPSIGGQMVLFEVKWLIKEPLVSMFSTCPLDIFSCPVNWYF